MLIPVTAGNVSCAPAPGSKKLPLRRSVRDWVVPLTGKIIGSVWLLPGWPAEKFSSDAVKKRTDCVAEFDTPKRVPVTLTNAEVPAGADWLAAIDTVFVLPAAKGESSA